MEGEREMIIKNNDEALRVRAAVDNEFSNCNRYQFLIGECDIFTEDSLCKRLFPRVGWTEECPCGVYKLSYIKARTTFALRQWEKRYERIL